MDPIRSRAMRPIVVGWLTREKPTLRPQPHTVPSIVPKNRRMRPRSPSFRHGIQPHGFLLLGFCGSWCPNQICENLSLHSSAFAPGEPPCSGVAVADDSDPWVVSVSVWFLVFFSVRRLYRLYSLIQDTTKGMINGKRRGINTARKCSKGNSRVSRVFFGLVSVLRVHCRCCC